jgi:predicted ATPase
MLFTSLGVFVGGFTIDGAEAVGGGDALDSVETLLAASLLQAEPAVADEPRFGMLETIREFALERLEERQDADEIRHRHAGFYLELGERAEPGLCGTGQGKWLERLDAELGNLRTALAWSAGGGDQDIGLRLGAALWRYWQFRGYVVEGRETLERLLAKRSGSRAARAAAQLSAGRCAMVQGDFDALDRFVGASLPVHRRLGDDHSVSFALGIWGLSLNARGDREQGQSLLAEALETARRSGDTWNEARTLCYIGILAAAEDLTKARHLLEEGLRGTRELGDLRGVGWVLASLAGVALAAGDSARARARLEEALALNRELGDTWGIAQQLESLGSLSMEDGDLPAARQLLDESLEAARDAHYRPLMAASLESLARLALAERRPDRAACLFGSASVLRERVAAHPMQTARASQDSHLDAVRSALGEEGFAEAFAHGRAMTLDQAVAHALEWNSAEAPV